MNNYRKPVQKRFSRRQRHYTPPIPPKRCVVENIIAGVKMYHDETKRVLIFELSGAYTVFESVQKARAAIWRTLQQDLVPRGHASELVIKPIREEVH